MMPSSRFLGALTCLALAAGAAGCTGEAEPDIQPVSAPKPPPGPYDKPGFAVSESHGRLWVFKEGSKDLAEFLKTGEPAKQVTRPAAGPGGLTVKSSDPATIDEYLLAREGFAIRLVQGRAWVFRAGSKDLAEFDKTGEPAKQITRPAAGPGGITLKSSDSATLDAYRAAMAR